MIEHDPKRFIPHSRLQDDALFSTAPITCVATGIQWGKTKVGNIWMDMMMHRHKDPSDNFIVTAPNYKIMQQATIPDFLRYMESKGDYNKTDAIFKMSGGGTCYFRTATDPDSVVGITNVRAIYCDEAGLYGLYFWENIQGRSSFRKAPIMITTSPYSLNWVYKDLIRPTLRGERTDVKLIQASSNMNPYFPKDEYERKKKVMDKRRFDMMYGGEWNLMSGLVYNCFSHDENLVDPYTLPEGTKYYAGVDWGHTDPFVIVIIGITPQGGRVMVGEYYKTETIIQDQVEIAIAKNKVFKIERWYCDPSRPDSIIAFQRAGLVAMPADNSIRMGIDVTYQAIKERKLVFIKGRCTHCIDELEMYHYPSEQDLKPDQDGKDQLPVGQYDHAMDSLRYVMVETTKLDFTGVRLPKRKPFGNTKGMKQVENWS